MTAIFAANDVMAFGVLQAALEPRHAHSGGPSLIGFDDIEFSVIVHPPLTPHPSAENTT